MAPFLCLVCVWESMRAANASKLVAMEGDVLRQGQGKI
jgi:hypothetical protein